MTKTVKFDNKNLVTHDRSYNSTVAGADEAGRGPLAGPVVCAVVIMPLGEGDIIDGITDSKQINEMTREQLYEQIITTAIEYNVAIVDNKIIDLINILEATKRGLAQAINGLKTPTGIILVDAVKKLDTKRQIEGIIKGDAKSYNIAAASIVAKVTRDRIMREYDKQFSAYGFASHKGYPTQFHYKAIVSNGLTDIHRRSFLVRDNKYLEVSKIPLTIAHKTK